MSRLRPALLAAVVGVFAMFATAAAAQAHEFRVEGAPLGAPVGVHAEESVKAQVLSGTPFGVAVHIECSNVVASGTITAGGAGNASLEFTKCKATKPANCTVKEPIVTKVNTQLVGPTPGVENEFKPETGEKFTTITLEGASCSLKEPFEVTGAQVCKLPGGETEAVQHKLECATTGSKLKAGGKAATFSGGVEELHLNSLEHWSAV